MEKILTVIIPTYNMEKYLRKCLDSLIVSDENMEKIEVLVVNDGSKDSSSQIAHEYEGKYPQTFCVIDKENGNYGSCINRGLKEATGKYIKVLDADDYLDCDVFDKFIGFLTANDADLFINDYCVVDEIGTIQETYTFQLPIGDSFSIDDLPDYVGRWLWHHGMAYRTQILRDMDYSQTEGISYTDDEWIFMPMVNVGTVCYYPENLYFYLRGREGQTFDPQVVKKSLKQKMIVAKSMLEFYSLTTKKEQRQVPRYCYLKLKNRLTVLYNLVITKFFTEEYNTELSALDSSFKDLAPKLYEELGLLHNRLGQHYVKKWRVSGHKRQWAVLAIRKFRMSAMALFKVRDNSMHMPNNIKRI